VSSTDNPRVPTDPFFEQEAMMAKAPKPEEKPDAESSTAQSIAAETTTLDDHVTKPSVTAPGDGPADTTDPTERATSVTPNPDDEAMLVGTVNAVKILPDPPNLDADGSEEADERIEEYKTTRPDGKQVTVRRNIETGKSEVVD
jgi:hypothetical protein